MITALFMKRLISFLILLFPIWTLISGQTGEEIFKTTCTACHTIGGGRLVGPDLKGIYNQRDNPWLISFIRSSQKMVKSGDKDAVAIFNEYNKVPMPDNNLTDDQIISIIDYIKVTDGASGTSPRADEKALPEQADSLKTADGDTMKTAISADSLKADAGGDTLKIEGKSPTIPTDTMQYSTETVSEGRALFNGFTPFKNKGSPCISCHNIQDQSLLGGGKIALDLTYSYSKLGPAGLNAILTNPPFPVMRTAMLNHPLTPEETQAIISLLKSVDDRNKANEVPQSGGVLFLAIGIMTALFLLVHTYVFYDNRKIG